MICGWLLRLLCWFMGLFILNSIIVSCLKCCWLWYYELGMVKYCFVFLFFFFSQILFSFYDLASIAALHLPQRSKLQAPPSFTLSSSKHLQTCTTDLVKKTWRFLPAPQGVSRSLPLSRPGSSPEGGGCTSSGSDCPRWTAYVDGVPEICPDWFLPPRLYCEQKLPAW